MGEIIETIERNGRMVATVAISSGTVNVILDPAPGFHLGDVLRIDTAIIIKAVKQQLLEGGPDDV